MKFSIVGPVFPYRGGIAHYTALLENALRTHGHTVQVVSFRRQYPGWLYPGRSDRDPSKIALRVDAEYLLDPLEPWRWLQAARRIGTERPDLIVIQWWTTFWAPAFAALATLLRHRGFRVNYLIHNTLPHEVKPFDIFLAKLALRKGDAFIIQTERERKRLLDLLPQAHIRLCFHPVYQPFTAQTTTRLEARRQLGLPEQTPILLFFGIVRAYKGLRYLLEAVAELSFEIKEFKLIIAGEFWEDIAIYQKLIADLNITDHVHLENRYIPNEDADLLFSAADALVAPYIGGTQSGVSELALGYGLPLIVTEPVAQGIDSGISHFLRVVPPKDAKALAEAIRELLINLPELRVGERPAPDDWTRLVNVLEDLAQPGRNFD